MNRDEGTTLADRREWMTRLLRGGALGLITAGIVYLVGRRAADRCPTPTLRCRSCQLLSRCELPSARKVRDERTRKEHS